MADSLAADMTLGYAFECAAAVVTAGDAIAVETAASIGVASIRSGIIVEDAAKIAVPIYFCLGARDVSPDPHAEASYFKRSPDYQRGM